jgi:hypothetical protein
MGGVEKTSYAAHEWNYTCLAAFSVWDNLLNELDI